MSNTPPNSGSRTPLPPSPALARAVEKYCQDRKPNPRDLPKIPLTEWECIRFLNDRGFRVILWPTSPNHRSISCYSGEHDVLYFSATRGAPAKLTDLQRACVAARDRVPYPLRDGLVAHALYPSAEEVTDAVNENSRGVVQDQVEDTEGTEVGSQLGRVQT